ncbi:hypothetical protein [Sphingobium sp. LSP13-1-1.1]|uniref:hypothetical protein n=1 Tax=Sphingobium sp. LSP13-1-1.1 TaxID=3135234 RepID=UPI00342DA1CF
MMRFPAKRTLLTVHGEAFQLMLYQPKDKGAIGPDLWIWNSRDGVTPFGTKHLNLDYLHAMQAYQPTYWGAIPDGATHVWIDYDRAAWEAMARRRYELFSARDDEYGADFRSRFPEPNAWVSTMEFEHGQPRMVTRQEFLQATPSFMARFT